MTKHEYKLLVRQTQQELEDELALWTAQGWVTDGGVFIQKNMPSIEPGYSLRIKRPIEVADDE